MNAMKERYRKEIVPVLKKELNLENIMQVPNIKKIVINIGMGEALDDTKTLDAASSDLEKITGQKPILTKAKKRVLRTLNFAMGV